MSCPSSERLAAAASGEDDDVLAHVDDCAACQRVLDEQLSIHDLLGQLPSPALLSARHRESLAAEVMARADALPSRRRWITPVLGGALAAAAALVIVLATRDRSTPATHVVVAPVLAPDDVGARVRETSPEAPAPQPAPPQRARLDGNADYARAVDASGDHETVTLVKGELTVDAREATPVRVITGDTSIALHSARAKVTARAGVIAQVQVYAGSAEITLDGRKHVIVAGTVWERSPAAASLDAFRRGWTALHDGRNADAIAAFDSATDPVVAEDAMYWAAVASERMGDRDSARQRYERLLARFPTSTRANDATSAVERLGR